MALMMSLLSRFQLREMMSFTLLKTRSILALIMKIESILKAIFIIYGESVLLAHH
jgi:hypothetical protein